MWGRGGKLHADSKQRSHSSHALLSFLRGLLSPFSLSQLPMSFCAYKVSVCVFAEYERFCTAVAAKKISSSHTHGKGVHLEMVIYIVLYK